MLVAALCKALKDPFLHCRSAGLRAAAACLALIDVPQLATKLLPQVRLSSSPIPY